MGRHYERGSALYNLGRYREAIEEYTQELSEEPESSLAFAMRGASLINLKKDKQAEKDVRTAIALAPEMSYAHFLLSIILANRGRRRPAEKAIREALRLEPSAHNFQHLAWIYFIAERHGECLKATESALELDPHHEPSLILRAKVLSKTGRADEARDLLRVALTLDAESPEAHREMGAVILQIGHAKDALSHLLEARRIDPVGHNDRVSLASAYGRLFWPLNRIDAFLASIRHLSVAKRWILVNVTATTLIVTLLITKPDDHRFSITAAVLFAIVANAVALFGTFDWIARIAALIRLHKELRPRWGDYEEIGSGILGILIAHGVASLAAVSLTVVPALYFIVLSLVILCWDSFYLLGHLSCMLASTSLPIVGLGFFIASVSGAMWMPDRPRLVILYWTVFLLISFTSVILRIKNDSSAHSDI